MAWVQPPTWRVGEYPSSAKFNQISDALRAIGGAWTAYVPTWYAFTTQPAVGNGAVGGWYARAGSTCAVRIVLFAGSTTTQGSGGQGFSLPFVANQTGPHGLKVRLSTGSAIHRGSGAMDSGDWGVFPWVPTSTANPSLVRLSSTSPNVGTGGYVLISGVYECTDEVASAPPVVPTYTQTFTATASRAYTEAGNDTGSNNIYQGYASATRGNRRSAVWFDSAAIAAWVAGRTVTRVTLRFTAAYTYATPSKAEIGWHTDGTVRSTYGAIVGKAVQQLEVTSPAMGAETRVNLTGTLANWGNGTNKGIIVGPGLNNSNTYQMQINGALQASPPRLEIEVA